MPWLALKFSTSSALLVSFRWILNHPGSCASDRAICCKVHSLARTDGVWYERPLASSVKGKEQILCPKMEFFPGKRPVMGDWSIHKQVHRKSFEAMLFPMLPMVLASGQWSKQRPGFAQDPFPLNISQT